MMKFVTCVTSMIGQSNNDNGNEIFDLRRFRYRACLALQITNLFTRAMFAYRLKMNDLPAVSDDVRFRIDFLLVILVSRIFQFGRCRSMFEKRTTYGL